MFTWSPTGRCCDTEASSCRLHDYWEHQTHINTLTHNNNNNNSWLSGLHLTAVHTKQDIWRNCDRHVYVKTNESIITWSCGWRRLWSSKWWTCRASSGPETGSESWSPGLTWDTRHTEKDERHPPPHWDTERERDAEGRYPTTRASAVWIKLKLH